jgi:hypothetical protein
MSGGFELRPDWMKAGAKTPAEAAAAAQAEHEKPYTRIADAIYGPAAQQPNKAATAPGAAGLYPVDVAMESTYAGRADDHRTVLGRSEAERIAHNEAFTEDIVRKPGFDPYGLGKVLHDYDLSAQIADARGEPDIDDAQLAAWSEETRQKLHGAYDGGPALVDDLLARAQKFTSAHPKLHELLGRRGIGSRPDVVLAIVEHVWRTDWR